MSFMRFGGTWATRVALLVGMIAAPVMAGEGREQIEAKAVGRKVAGFTLKDTGGQDVSLTDFRERKAIIVAFLGTECPLANAYAGRLNELHKEFSPRGVQFLVVNSNCQDSADEVAAHARKYEISFPVLKDRNGEVADLFEAKRTPSVFLLDADGIVRYRGRVDDQNGIGSALPKPTRRDLAEALEEVLAGKAVSTPVTPETGCFIGRDRKKEAAGKVTYAKDVAIILQKNCQECHRPGQIGPFSLMTYKQARAWSTTVREVIVEKRMPPWHADPKHGTFANDRSLPPGERDTLLAWIDQGCPEGDTKDLPKPREFPEGWGIGKPDLVLSMKEAYRVPAKAPDGGIPYQLFELPTNFDRDVWVQAVEVRPGNTKVVHHMVAYIGDRPSDRETVDRDILGGYVPGRAAGAFPKGLAKRIPKGEKISLEMHYTTNGTEQMDQSSIGLIFATEPPKHELRSRFIQNREFAIPPGAADHKVVASTTFDKDAMLLSLSPHMHVRGKAFEFRAFYPDGKEEVLLSVPKYDFMWQHTYALAKPRLLPAGTRVECTARFDNSAKNRNNPDPTKEVRWGDQSWEEMALGAVGYVWQDEEPAKEKGR